MRTSVLRLFSLAALALLLPACGIGGAGTLTPTTAPGIPSAAKAVGGNGRVTLTWTSPGAATGFTVSRALSTGGPYFPVPQTAQFPTPTSCVDLGLQNGTTYFYVITAFNAFGTSPPSVEVQATPRFAAAAIAAGSMCRHTLAVFEDGTVWGWGYNAFGELGLGAPNYQSTPALATGLPHVAALARGDGFSLALASDGHVWTWGSNADGALGRTTPAGALGLVPTAIAGLPAVISVAAGSRHSLALAGDGTVWTWGYNAAGELGRDTGGLPDPTPAPVAALSGAVAIAGGVDFSLALRNDGTVWGWGRNDQGSLGNGGTASPAISPTQVKNLNGVVRIAAGYSHALALRTDGTVWAWGYNGSGQLGNGAPTTTPVSTPVAVSVLRNVVSIACGSSHSLAAQSDGTVWAWGDNEGFGALGNGVQSGIVSTPAQVPTLTAIEEVAGGYYHSIALGSDGRVWCWGENSDGNLGIGQGVQESLAGLVQNLDQVISVASGSNHGQAVRSDGTVWAWGSNGSGQLGNGTVTGTTQSLPAQVSVLAGMTATAAGSAHGAALKSDGTVWTWGSNSSGQIGNGTTSATPVSTPFQVPVASTVFTAVSAGLGHTLALKNDGTVWSWGANNSGQLGNGTSGAAVASPAKISALSGITAISAGGQHNLALKNDGSVWAWGLNSSGQIGNNGSPGVAVTTPVKVLTGMAAVGAGATHSLAVGTDGSVWAWGSNSSGELGVVAGLPVPLPSAVPGILGMSSVSAGANFSVARAVDGTVRSWGTNLSSQLGDGTSVSRETPAPVPGVSGVTALSAGPSFAMALGSSGLVWAWGLNVSEQLGVPFLQFSASPVVITH